MKLETFKQCLWHNVYAREPVLAGTVALGDAFVWTTENLSPALRTAFEDAMPGVLPHSGSLAAAEMVARIAQHLQLLADVSPAVCGVVSLDSTTRSAVVFFSCRDFSLAQRCLSLAIQIVDRLTQAQVNAERLAKMIKSCFDAVDSHGFTSRTREMIEAATRRGIPWHRVSPLVRHIQLGQGFRQQRFWNTLFGTERLFGSDYSWNKLLTMNVLQQIRLPVGRFASVRDVESALRAAGEIGYPLVLKPIEGSKGDSVYVNLRDESELRAAVAAARVHERAYLLQTFFPGEDHRMLVVSGKLVAVMNRTPASVIGDGRHTIAELVPITNADPRRIVASNAVPIVLDEECDRILAQQGLTRGSIPGDGQTVRVRATANVATGGTVRVLDIVHPDNARAAERAAQSIGLIVAGVDLICPDITKSWRETGGGICEVNAAVGLTHPLATSLDIRGKIIEAFYPEGDDGRIPTAVVTGTGGKSTTCVMLASILSCAGHTVGCATTEGVTIGPEMVERNNLASADGASIVLRDATVTAAVLETTRQRLAKEGLYLDRCDVAALLNVQSEQIETGGIETLDDMAALMRKVLDAARRAVVLNADDPRCLALASEFSPSVKTILFSRSRNNGAVRDHRGRGGDVVFLDLLDGHETVVAASASGEVSLIRTADIRASSGDQSGPKAANAAAAAALALGMGVNVAQIREGLRQYSEDFPAAGHPLS